MLRISPITGVHFKVCFGVAKIIESSIEHFIRVLFRSNDSEFNLVNSDFGASGDKLKENTVL